MAAKHDMNQWHFFFTQTDNEVVELASGTLFPKSLRVLGRYADGPLVEMLLEVEDGRPTLASVTVSRANDGPPLTASMVHDLPVGLLFDETVARLGSTTLALVRASQAAMEGRSHQFLTDAEAAAARAGASGPRRGRPVRSEDLERTAEILRANTYDPRRQMRAELGVSTRTASRWIAEAKRRGLIEHTEED